MNNAGKAAAAFFSSGIYCALVSTLVATVIVDVENGQATLPVLLSDLELIGFFVALPAFVLGGIGGAILLKLRTHMSNGLAFVLSSAALGGAMGVIFVWLAAIFDPTTASYTLGSIWKVLILSMGTGSIVAFTYACLFDRWIKKPG